MQQYFVQTVPGVEDIAWLEIKAELHKPQFGEKLFARDQYGIITFGYEGDPGDLFELRTAEERFLLVHSSKISRGWSDLYDLTKELARSDQLAQAVDQLMVFQRATNQGGDPTYQIRARTNGRYEFKRHDLERSVHKGFQAKYPHWRPLTSGQGRINIAVDALGSHLLIGLALADPGRRTRITVPEKNALPSSVAAAMVLLTEPAATDQFLDPLCENGMLLMTRRVMQEYGRLLGATVSPKGATAVETAVLNQRREPPVNFALLPWQGNQLPLADGEVTKVAARLPSPRERPYPQLFSELERVLASDGRAVVISDQFEAVKTAVRTCPALTILTGYSVMVNERWQRIYIMRKE